MPRRMPQLSLNIDLQARSLVKGFYNTVPDVLPNVFQGDTLTVYLRFLNSTGIAQTPYTDADQSTSFVEAAIGTVAGLPSSGTFTITDPDAAQTTASISCKALASDVQSAIRAGLSTNWSLATVTGNTAGPWIVINGANSARSRLTVQGGSLVPVSFGDVEIQAAGSGSTAAIQWIKLQTSPIAYQNTWTPYPAPSITVANVQTGGVSGSNSIQSVTLNNQPYSGTFTISFGGQTTAPLACGSSLSQVQTTLQALSTIGSGNVFVGGNIGAYLIIFTGTLGGAAQANLTASATGLIGPVMLVGTLSLATVSLEEAIGESTSISQTFELRVTPFGGSPQTVLQVPVSIFNDLIPNAPTNPTPTALYYTQSQVNAIIAVLTAQATETFASSGVDASSIPVYCKIFTLFAAALAGTGAYTRALNLSAANRQPGDKFCFSYSMAASVNPTVTVQNNAGTVIWSEAGSGVAYTRQVWFTFGTDWTSDQ